MVGSTRITVVSEGVAARRSSAIEQKDGAHRKRAKEKRGDTPPRFASGDGAAATAAPADWILHCVTQQPTKRRSAKSPAHRSSERQRYNIWYSMAIQAGP